MSEVSGNDLNIKAMIQQFGAISGLVMHPDYYDKIEKEIEQRNSTLEIYWGLPVTLSPFVKDWWPMFEGNPNPSLELFTKEAPSE